MNRRTWLVNLAIAFGLLALVLTFFFPVLFGGRTLLPLDNLFAFPPWRSYAAQLGVTTPHNELVSDLILQNYTWKWLIVEALQAKELPLWNPYILAGQPFLAAGQHSALYPLSVLFYIMPIERAFGFFTAAQLFLAAVFMYIFARTLRLPRLASLLTAIAFAFSGFMVVSIVHPMIIAAASWLPLLLATVERLVRTQEEQSAGQRPVRYIPWLAVGAIAFGCHFLAGHPEISYYVVLVTLFYAAWRIAIYWKSTPSWPQAAKLAAAVLLMVGLGAGLAAVQLLPLYELVTQNFRQESASYRQVISWAYPWRRLIAFAVPDFFGNPTHHSYVDAFSWQRITDLRNAAGASISQIYWDVKNYVEGGSYVGTLPLVLAAVALWRLRSRRVWAFALLAVVSLLFVFGTPLYALLYFLLPGIRQLHSPFRWVYPYTISVCVLAGFGASWLAEPHDAKTNRQVHRLGLLILTGGLAGIMGLAIASRLPGPVGAVWQRALEALALATEAFADGRAFFSYELRNLLIFFVALAGAGLVLLLSVHRVRWRRWHLWKLLAAGIVAAELTVIGRGFAPAADPRILQFVPPAVAFLQEDKALWRLTTLDQPNEKLLNANAAMIYGLSDVRGYDSIIIRQYVEYMELIAPQGELLYNRIAPLYDQAALGSPLLDALNVKYVLTTQTLEQPDYTLVYDGEVRIYRNDGCLPRAFVVHQARVIPDADERRQALAQLDPRREVILEQAPGAAMTTDTAAGLEPVQQIDYGLNEVLITLDLSAPGYLVLADNYFPGWKAYDTQPGSQEQEIPIYRANGTLRAVALASGAHVVRFKYTPFSIKLGLFFSFLSGVVLFLLLAYWAWRLTLGKQSDDTTVKRVARNALTPMVLNLVNRGIDMAFAMLYLRMLGPESSGGYGFAINFIGYFETFVLFGLGTYLTREISKSQAQAGRYWGNSMALRLLLWLASLLPITALCFAYARFSGLTRDTILAIAFFAAALLPELVSDSFSAVFYAHEKMEFPAAIASVTTVLRVTLGTLALLLGHGFVGLAATSLVVNISTAVILGTLAARLFFRPQLQFDPPFARTIFRASFPLMTNNLLSKVFFMSDVLLLKPLRGDVEVGYYGAAYRFIRGLDVIPSFFTMAIFPLISRLADSQRDSLVRAYTLSIKLLLLVALPIATGTTFIARELILILAGPDFLPQSQFALQVLIWYMPVGFVNSVTHYVLIAINQQRFLTKAFVLGAAFNIISNLIMIPRYGYLAAAAITALSELALFLPFYYCVRKNLTRLSWLELAWRPVLAASAMAAAMWLRRGTSALLLLPLGAAVYVAVLVAVGTFRQPDVALVLELLPARLKRWIPRGVAHLDQGQA